MEKVEMSVFNQSVMARELGVSLATISRLRSGDRNPTLEVMFRIDKMYGWSIGDQATAWKNERWLAEFEGLIHRISVSRVNG